MLRINAIKISANTVDGIYSASYKFSNGYNIIRGDNTSGKSTLVQSILYGLGMEELLDGTNTKTMQSTLKDAVEYPKGTLHKVIESHIILEISNTNTITVKRSVINQTKSPKLIEVYEGSLLTGEETNLKSNPMWIHDKGGATNTTYGFHAYLAEFLNLNLPDVYYTSGELRKLYLQTIFPAFIIEQKKGWADFLMTIPHYKIRDAKSRAIEFILELDVFENQKKKLAIKQQKQNLIDTWKYLREDLYDIAFKGAVDIEGIPINPDSLNSLDFSFFSIIYEDSRISLKEYLSILIDKYTEIKNNRIETTGSRIKEIEVQIRSKQDQLDTTSINFELLSRNVKIEIDKNQIYKRQLDEVRDELQQNKDAKKIYSLGAKIELAIPKERCPTCNQQIKDSLLPQSIPHTPMHLDENIKYLKAQEKMIIAYIVSQEKSILKKEEEIGIFYKKMRKLREEIRGLKRELVEDERLPSITQIEEKIKLESKINFYTNLIEVLENKLDAFKELSVNWDEILRKEAKLKKNFLSESDNKKLFALETNFKKLVATFGYRSKPLNNIKISKEKYLPIVEGDSIKYDIRFDSSASDMIRSIWSFTCSLYKVSKEFDCNHPKLLLFDEPAQQSMSNSSFNSFLKELETYNDCQILLFASFNNSDSDFTTTTNGVENFNYINIGLKLLKPEDNSQA